MLEGVKTAARGTRPGRARRISSSAPSRVVRNERISAAAVWWGDISVRIPSTASSLAATYRRTARSASTRSPKGMR